MKTILSAYTCLAAVAFPKVVVAAEELAEPLSSTPTMQKLFGDWLVFPIFEAVIAIVFIFAIVHDGWRRHGDGIATVQRGPKSRAAFYVAFGMISLVLIHVVNSTSALVGFKTVFHLFNFTALVYIVFFNSWGRNKVIGVVNAFEQWEER